MTGSEKLAAVGLGAAVVIGLVVLAYSVSECRRLHRRWSAARAADEADEARREALERGCDWARKVD